MCNLWFNIRFGERHFQLGPDGVSFDKNPAHAELRKLPEWKWFQIYSIFGKHQ